MRLKSVHVPSPTVLARFGAAPEPKPLSGGQGTAWRAGDVVLKPLDMSVDALQWQAELLASLEPDGVPRRGSAAVQGGRAGRGRLAGYRSAIDCVDRLLRG